MFRKAVTFGGIVLVAAAVVVATPSPGLARGGGHGGGGHFGGGHFGGGHFGGYHAGFYHRGYHPHFGYGRSYGFYPDYGYTYDPYYYGSGVVTTPGYAEPVPLYYGETSSTPPATFFPTGDSQSDRIAQLTVNVPADAQVWFEDQLTTATGAARHFDSPPLVPGSRYIYDIKARWNDHGREVTQEQQVEVSAGDHIDVRFPLRANTTGAAPAATHG